MLLSFPSITDAKLESYIQEFPSKVSQKNFEIPESFENFVKREMLPPADNLTNFWHNFSAGNSNLRFNVSHGDVTNLPSLCHKIEFSLAIMDVPYGLKVADWDEQVLKNF